MNFLISSLVIAIAVDQAQPLTIDTCNCSQAVTKGTIDLEDPDYCSHPEPVETPKQVIYTLFTKDREPITWDGYACTQWLASKEISTNFLLSHDTVFKKQILQVSANECWATAQYPYTCVTNPMAKDGKTYRYLQEPEGEGYWMTTQAYTSKNCITQTILLSKECHDCPVMSPFGILANNSMLEFSNHNDLTIVWKNPDPQEPTCGINSVFQGRGNLTKGKKESKLEDNKSQLEFIMSSNETTICTNTSVYKVLGIPDTFLKIEETKLRTKRVKRSLEREPGGVLMLASNTKLCLAYPPRSGRFSIPNCVFDENLSPESQYYRTVSSGQHFKFLTNGYIVQSSFKYCINQNVESILGLIKCLEPSTGQADAWILSPNPISNAIIPFQVIQSHTGNCLTTNETADYTVYLDTCKANNTNQFWLFEQLNADDELLEFTSISEQQNPNSELAAFGTNRDQELKQKFDPPSLYGKIQSIADNRYCLSITLEQTLSIEKCYNHSAPSDYPKQQFTYSYGKIRVQGTNTCVTTKTTQRCDETLDNIKWDYDIQTKQFIVYGYSMCLTAYFNDNTVRTIQCNSQLQNQEWKFERDLVPTFLPLDKIDELIKVRKEREARNNKKRKGRTVNNERLLEITDTTGKTTPSNVTTPLVLTDNIRELLNLENKQYNQGQAVKHESQLANEVRQLYCKITSLQRNQAMILAQTNGLLAARALNLEKCSRVKGNGKSLVLQQCDTVSIKISALQTQCGYQPFFQTSMNGNFTVGKDGWSLHPFQDCFWNGQFVNLNDKTYTWINGEWRVQVPSIHVLKLNLIKQFQDLPLKSYDYLPQHHSMYETNNVEQLNVMSELISRIQQSNTNSLSGLVLDNRSQNNFWDMTSWMSIFKYGSLIVIAIIFTIILIWFCITCIPFSKIINSFRRYKVPIDVEQNVPMLPISKRPTCTNIHNDAQIIPGRGLCWNDGCLITPQP